MDQATSIGTCLDKYIIDQTDNSVGKFLLILIHTHIHIYHIFRHTHINEHIQMHKHMHILMQTHTYIGTYFSTHIYEHTHTYTYILYKSVISILGILETNSYKLTSLQGNISNVVYQNTNSNIYVKNDRIFKIIFPKSPKTNVFRMLCTTAAANWTAADKSQTINSVSEYNNSNNEKQQLLR